MIISLFARAAAPVPFARRGEPVTVGVPLPKGLAADVQGWRLTDALSGVALPHQVHVLDRWSDGSVRWALVDCQTLLESGAAGSEMRLALSAGDAPSVAGRLLVARGPRGVQVETGALSCALSTDSPLLMAGVASPSGTVIGADGMALRLAGADGEPFVTRWREIATELDGPVRAVVVAHGDAVDAKGRKLELALRYDFFSGSTVARLRLTVRNPTRARHPGGIWELGDAGSLLLRECTISMRPSFAAGESRLVWSSSADAEMAVARARVRVYQESSGGERWASSNHRNRAGVVPMTFCGYRVEADGHSQFGQRATPIVVVERGGQRLGATAPEFWQNFPRAIGAAADRLDISFLPAEFPDAHELLGGEQKTHEAYLLFGDDPVGGPPLEWCRQRLVGHVSPEWYAEAQAVPYLVPASADPNIAYLTLVNAAIEGHDTFEDKRERLDEYGWRHFGDVYGDHEAVLAKTAEPLVSHYNNQYDPVGGFAYQFMRTGDLRWWRQCRELAAHVVDIDTYHTDQDKSAYNHGLFWHTAHYLDAGLAGHRSYPRGTGGGGPASEQNYSTGLMLHYFMTGDRPARDVAVRLARFVIDMDDGRRSIFRWLDRGYTGLATFSGSLLYHGPGRGSGNSLNALVDGYRLSGDRVYLDKAEQIIRRCSHPSQDIVLLNLLDSERKWFYTMFLQALGKYLDLKAERGELDEMYRYGQSTLLHFARWMADHEYPFLDKPEILEYPTETWSAQDMRKSEVFNYAACHARGEERMRFIERGRYFFGDACRKLSGMPTRTLARPVVLLLSFGFTRAYLDGRPNEMAPTTEPWTEPDRRPPFVPQRVRARARAIGLAAAATLVLLAGAGWLVMRFIA